MSKPKRSEMERFWEKTTVEGSHILWTGHVNTVSGYGYFEASDPTTKRHHGFRSVLAHRFIYQRVTGYTLPSNSVVMHSCDIRRCGALQHLSHGSYKANMEDAMNKGRLLRGEQRSRLTNEQVLEIRRLCASGMPQTKVGALFGVHQVTISKIMLRKVWTHI